VSSSLKPNGLNQVRVHLGGALASPHFHVLGGDFRFNQERCALLSDRNTFHNTSPCAGAVIAGQTPVLFAGNPVDFHPGGICPTPTCTKCLRSRGTSCRGKPSPLMVKVSNRPRCVQTQRTNVRTGSFRVAGIGAKDWNHAAPQTNGAARRMADRSSGRGTCQAVCRISGFIAVVVPTK